MINKKELLNDFKHYLEENEIKAPTIQNINNYICFKHYDIIDELDGEELDKLDEIEKEIENILYKTYNLTPIKTYTKHFLDDFEKIQDLLILSKDEFLQSYNYISIEEYDKTTEEILELVKSTVAFRKKILTKNKIFTIEEYLEKINIKPSKKIDTIDELMELAEQKNFWSYCVEDFDEIKSVVVLVKDKQENKRYFEIEKTETI